MKKICINNQGEKVIASRMVKLRNLCGYSQRELAEQLQLKDFNVDKTLLPELGPIVDSSAILKSRYFLIFWYILFLPA